MTSSDGIRGIAQACITLNINEVEKLRKQAYSCKQCASCREWHWTDENLPGYVKGVTKTGSVICPIYRHSPGFLADFAEGKVKIAQGLVDGKISINDRVIEKLYQCTQCASCSEYCPQTRVEKLDPAEVIRASRGILKDKGSEPPRLIQIMIHRPEFPKPLPERWIHPQGISSEHAPLAFFPGCVFGQSFKQPNIATDFISLLDHLKESYQVIREGFCCGYPAFIAGDTRLAQKIATHTAERIKSLGVETLLVTCAWCYRMFKREYTKILDTQFKINVVHAVEFINTKVNSGLLRLQRPIKAKATFHDPCQLGRRCGVFEAPRELARSIPGINLVEMEDHHEESLCSGGGGGVAALYPGLSERIAYSRVMQAQKVNADVIFTACPYCRSSLQKGAGSNGVGVKIIDLVQAVSFSASVSENSLF